MDKLYQRLQASYGHKFASMFPDAQCVADWHEAWGAGLADLTLADVAGGLNALLAAHPEWSPALGEFRALCKPRSEPAHQKLLPPPAREAANVSKHIVEARKALGKPVEWWKQANRMAVEILQQSGDPNAPGILTKISEHNPALFEKREPWWAK
jgi:hypothetical protein